jgi:hypothetical protein
VKFIEYQSDYSVIDESLRSHCFISHPVTTEDDAIQLAETSSGKSELRESTEEWTRQQ